MIRTTNQTDADLNTRSLKQGDTELILSPCSPNQEQFVGTPASDQQEADLSSTEHVAVTRLDAMTGQWTIFAPDRTQRPDEFRDVISAQTINLTCPFCSGNETETPRPVWVARELDLERIHDDSLHYLAETDAKDWAVRVVPNKYPAVTPHASSAHAVCSSVSENQAAPVRASVTRPANFPGSVSASANSGLFQHHPNLGGHEVIVESPRHDQSFTDLNHHHAALVFIAYRDRIRFWREQSGIHYISVFKNAGPQAGASLSHSHSQLIATSHLPAHLAAVARTMNRHQAQTGCCLQCDLIRGEVKAKTRIVARTQSLVAFCPFASRLPMLVRITTTDHLDRFELLPIKVIEELSHLVSRITVWLQQIHPGVSYNYILNTRPPSVDGVADAHHWSMEIFPRLTQMAGFEWGSHSMINPILPEVAAALFRSRAAAEDPRQIL